MAKIQDVLNNIIPVHDVQKAHNILAQHMDQKNMNVYDVVKDNREFFHLMSFLSAQQKALEIERFLADKLQGTRVPSSLDRGDMMLNDEYYELKTSTTNKGRNLNIRQIRPWQDVQYYICSYIEEKAVENSHFFKLSNDEMLQEVDLMGGFTHGTKSANESNVNSEYSITVKVFDTENEHTQRWKQEYWYNDLYELIVEN